MKPIFSQAFIGLFETALEAPPEKTGIFLDTGAIIDIENGFTYKINGHKFLASRPSSSGIFEMSSIDSCSKPSELFAHFQKLPYQFLVTPEVFEEVRQHHYHHRHNGKPEISKESLYYIENFLSDYSLCRRLFRDKCQIPFGDSFVSRTLDHIGYDTHWASMLAFPLNHKKFYIDPISRPDRGLITAALGARYLGDFQNVVIISPDSHILDTVRILSGRHPNAFSNYSALMQQRGENINIEGTLNFGYDGISAFSSRPDFDE